MFCPQCGTGQSEELRFCKQCGVNLEAVRQSVATRDAGGKIDWSKTWVAEMFMSEAERIKRHKELEQLMGITPDTPELKRYKEIKAGVIVSLIGVALMIFLSVIMEGIILSGQNPPSDVALLSRVWVAGVIPFFVGLGLLINGLFVSKKLVAHAERQARAGAQAPDAIEHTAAPPRLQSAGTTEFVPANFSVTEDTTKHLKTPR